MKKRLIDADALDFEFDRRCFSEEDENYVRGVDEAIGVVKNAPTINPDDLVKHGEWEEVRKENIWGDFVPVFKCSACRKYKIRTIGIIRKSNYCPNCGAKMDGGKENE